MGRRYIEVKEGNKVEMEWVLERCSKSFGEAHDGVVRLRGLPYGCTKQDIGNFFEGMCEVFKKEMVKYFKKCI